MTISECRTRARRRLYRRMRRAIEVLSCHRREGADRIAEKLAGAGSLEEIQEVRRRELEPALDELDLEVAPELDGADVQIGESG